MKKGLLVFSFLILIQPSFSQEFRSDIEKYLNIKISEIPGSSGNDYQIPVDIELNTWSNILDFLLVGNTTSANSLAFMLNYKIVTLIDTTLKSNNKFYVIEEKKPQNRYWGTYVLSADPLRDKLVIQAPHPLYDSKTGLQSVFCFKRLIPKALFISGTHRCNSSQYSSCSGTTTACGTSSPYKVSDNAHNTNSVFQKITETLFDKDPDAVFVQLHGFAKGADDPYVIMSNGTTITPNIDYVSLIKNGLQQADPDLTFKLAHIDLNWTRLIAFTNTQGRYVNNSANPCTQNATQTNGNFVHIEQERNRLRADSLGWYKMYLALKSAFAIDFTNTEAIENNEELKIYPNPNNGIFNINVKQNTQITIYNTNSKIVYRNLCHTDTNLGINLKSQPQGFYTIKVDHQDKTYTGKFFIIK